MSLTYTTYINSIVNLMPVDSVSNSGFVTMLPNMIDDAEQRLYRELDLMEVSVRATTVLTAGNRNLTLPVSLGTPVVTDEINVINPATVTDPELGTRFTLTPTSEEMLNWMWPNVNGSTTPLYFALINPGLAILGPWPIAAYTVEWVGTIRPRALSTTQATTILSVFFPDLLIAASMVFASGYMKNYGQGVDDPRQSVTWEGHLQSLLQSAKTEEARKKFTGPAWSSKDPSPLAPPRN